MKKVILISTILSVLATSPVFAESKFISIEGFYLKFDIGMPKLDPIKPKVSDEDGQLEFEKYKMRPNRDTFLELGAGYNINNIFRTDIRYFVTSPEYRYIEELNNLKKVSRINTKIKGFFLNGFVDVLDLGGYAKIFTGAGIGRVTIRPTFTNTFITKNAEPTPSREELRLTAVHRIVPAVYLGLAGQFNSVVTGEITYSYRYYGNCKFKLASSENTSSESLRFKMKYKGHHIAAGLRFNL